MNRHKRRAAETKKQGAQRGHAIRSAIDYLAHVAAPTATGATLFLPAGEVLFISADNARAMAASDGKGTPS